MRFDGFDVLVLVAVETHRIAGFFQQLWSVGLMWVVTGKTVIHGVMREFGFGLLEKIIVTLPAQRRASFNDQFLIVAGMRFVAGHAIPITDRLMHIFLFRNVLMAFHADFLRRFLQEPFKIRGMRRVAVQAIAGFDCLMFHFAGCERTVVADQAKLAALFNQEILIRRLMRVVAAGAFAIFHRLMFHLQPSHKILVAGETQLPRWQFRLRRHATIAVALRAFAFAKRLMNHHHRASREIWGRRYYAVLLVRRNGRRFIRDRIFGHSIEEKFEPLLAVR